jgi:PilZ domain
MPELLRSITSRLRDFVGNRRRATRHRVKLSAFIAVLDAAPGAPPSAGLAGYTRDVSDGGLALLLPSVRVGGRYLVGEGARLRITLKLDGTSARLYGTPVRYEQLDGAPPDARYLVGVRLDDTGDRAILADYLKSLEKG